MSKTVTQPLTATTPSADHARLQWRLDAISTATGVFLALFMWSHMLFVSTIWTGAVGFDWFAKIAENTWIAQLGGIVVVVAFFVHFVTASRKIPANIRQRRLVSQLGDDIKSSKWNISKEQQADLVKIRPHSETSAWLIQIRTGMVILVLGSVHLFVISTDLAEFVVGVFGFGAGHGITAMESMARVQSGLWILYGILLVAVEVHAGIGLYRVAVKWFLGSRLLGIRVTRELAHLGERVTLVFFLFIGVITLLVLAGVLPPPLAFLFA